MAADDEADTDWLKEFSRLGTDVEVTGDKVTVSRQFLEALRDQRREEARSITWSRTPATPPHLRRDGSGMAVARGAHRTMLSMEMLRSVREKSLVFKPIHMARQYQIRRLCRPWHGDKTQVGIRVVHKDYNERTKDPPEGFEKFIRLFESVLWSPNPDAGVRTLGDAIALLWEDYATINRPVVEPLYSAIDEKTIVQWKVLDGAKVWPTLAYAEHWLADGANRTGFGKWGHGALSFADQMDALSTRLRLDLVDAEYVYMEEGVPVATFKRGELLVAPRMARTDVNFAGYQPSHVEEAMEFARAYTDAFDFSAVQLSKGFFAEFILGLPSAMHPDDVTAFIDMIREKATGVAKAGQPLYMPLPPGEGNDLKVIPLKQPLSEMGFQQFLSVCTAKVATGIYRMHASTIGARPWDGGSGRSLNQGNMTEEIALAQEEGLQGDVQHLIDGVLNPLAMRCHPDLRVIAWYGDYDPQREASMYQQRASVDMTLNEVRMAQGLKPKGFWLPDEDLEEADDEAREKYDDNPYNHTAPFANMKMQAINQQKMMQAQQGMFGMGGGGGAGGGGGGDEDDEGFGDDEDEDGQGAPSNDWSWWDNDGDSEGPGEDEEMPEPDDSGFGKPLEKAARRQRKRSAGTRKIVVHLHRSR